MTARLSRKSWPYASTHAARRRLQKALPGVVEALDHGDGAEVLRLFLARHYDRTVQA